MAFVSLAGLGSDTTLTRFCRMMIRVATLFGASFADVGWYQVLPAPHKPAPLPFRPCRGHYWGAIPAPISCS